MLRDQAAGEPAEPLRALEEDMGTDYGHGVYVISRPRSAYGDRSWQETNTLLVRDRTASAETGTRIIVRLGLNRGRMKFRKGGGQLSISAPAFRVKWR